MGIYFDIIRSKFSKPKQYQQFPQWGFYLEVATKSFCCTVDKEGLFIELDDVPEETRKSFIDKLNLLPRFSWEFDYAGKRLILKSVPALETLLNLVQKRGPLLRLFEQQLESVPTPSKKREGTRKQVRTQANFLQSEEQASSNISINQPKTLFAFVIGVRQPRSHREPHNKRSFFLLSERPLPKEPFLKLYNNSTRP